LNILSLLPNLLLASAILALVILIVAAVTLVTLCVAVKVWFVVFRRKSAVGADADGQIRVGFFHPYCDAGGGGERVLWTGIRALRKRFPAAKLIVYTGDVEVNGPINFSFEFKEAILVIYL